MTPLTVQQRIEREGQHPEPGDVIVFTLAGSTVRVVEFRGIDPDYHEKRFYGRYLPENWHHIGDERSTGFMYGYRELLANGAYVSRTDGKPTVQGEE